MATAYLMIGLPGSGKTTYAKRIERDKNAVRFTLDEIMLTKYSMSYEHPDYSELATKEKDRVFENASALILSGRSVVLDWSFWSVAQRQAWQKKFSALNIACKFVYINTSLSLNRKQLHIRNQCENSQLVHIIPLDEFERFRQFFEAPDHTEGIALELVTHK